MLTVFPQILVIQNIGTSLRGHTVLNPQHILNEAWKIVTKVKDSEKYMACAEAWIYFIVKHFKVKQTISKILNVKHVIIFYE